MRGRKGRQSGTPPRTRASHERTSPWPSPLALLRVHPQPSSPSPPARPAEPAPVLPEPLVHLLAARPVLRLALHVLRLAGTRPAALHRSGFRAPRPRSPRRRRLGRVPPAVPVLLPARPRVLVHVPVVPGVHVAARRLPGEALVSSSSLCAHRLPAFRGLDRTRGALRVRIVLRVGALSVLTHRRAAPARIRVGALFRRPV